MSLLDEAKDDVAGRHPGCKLAKQLMLHFTDEELYKEGPNGEPPEVIELLVTENIDGAAKWRVLDAHGVSIAPQTINEKQRVPCQCVWCQKHWTPYMGVTNVAD